MAKLKTIRCHYCRKLLWSSRWSLAKREAYKNDHSCPGIDEQRREQRWHDVERCLEEARLQLGLALDRLRMLRLTAPKPVPSRRRKA